MTARIRTLFTLLILSVGLISGCSTLQGGLDAGKELVGLGDSFSVDGEPSAKFSDNPVIAPKTDRAYRRMTRSQMESENELQQDAGSMWVMEGQGAYLFAQNRVRRPGDLLNVRLEGSAQKQVDTKVSVIRDLLKQLEDEEKREREANLAAAQSDGGRNPASTNPAAATPAATTPPTPEEPIKIDLVPTRITERNPDGSYRVKGQQPFMIGKREYRVIVTGLIRPEDFNDQGVSSNVLLDPQYDVVTTRKKEL